MYKDTSSPSNYAIRISNNTLDFSMALCKRHTLPKTMTNNIKASNTTKDDNSPSIKGIRMITIKIFPEAKQTNFIKRACTIHNSSLGH